MNETYYPKIVNLVGEIHAQKILKKALYLDKNELDEFWIHEFRMACDYLRKRDSLFTIAQMRNESKFHWRDKIGKQIAEESDLQEKKILEDWLGLIEGQWIKTEVQWQLDYTENERYFGC
jgi:hypothetical protein